MGYVRVGGADTGYAFQGTVAYVETTGSVTVDVPILKSGEFYKAMPPTGSTASAKDSPSFTVSGGTTEPQPATDAQVAQAFVKGLTTGWNIERGSAWSLRYNNVNLSSGTAYYDYLRGLGVTHVRFFYPWRPDRDMLSSGQTGDNIPTNENIDRLLNAAQQAIAAGLPVFLDCTDVMELSAYNSYPTAVESFLDRFAVRVAGRTALTPAKFALGAFQELAAQSNNAFNALRLKGHTILRKRLPNHVLITGSAGWNSPSVLFDSNWAMVADKRVIAQWHDYNGSPTASGLQAQMVKSNDFSARNGGIPVVAGECGYDDNTHTAQAANIDRWVSHMDLYSKYCGMNRPMWWIVTGSGNDWRGNISTSDPTLVAKISDATKKSNTTIRALSAYVTENS